MQYSSLILRCAMVLDTRLTSALQILYPQCREHGQVQRCRACTAWSGYSCRKAGQRNSCQCLMAQPCCEKGMPSHQQHSFEGARASCPRPSTGLACSRAVTADFRRFPVDWHRLLSVGPLSLHHIRQRFTCPYIFAPCRFRGHSVRSSSSSAGGCGR